MTSTELRQRILAASTMEFTRSGGPGGQNVNKVNTQVSLWVSLDHLGLPAEALERVKAKLAGRITGEGDMLLHSSETRSQLRNRELVLDRAVQLLTEALQPRRHRRPTRATFASRERRLDNKRLHSERKNQRRFRPED